MKTTNEHAGYRARWSLALVIAWPVVGPLGVVAANEGMVAPVTSVQAAQQVSLVLGKSIVVDMPVAIKRASLADPQIADVIVLSPKQIYVTGKGYGSTNLTLWGKDDRVLAVFDLDVGGDLTRLTQHLGELFPDETNLSLKCLHDHVTVSGTVSSEARLSQVLAVAEAYTSKKVLNFLKVDTSPPGSIVPPDVHPVTVEVIKGTTVSSVKF